MEYYPTIKNLEQQSPTFLAPGANIMGDNFSMDWRWGDALRMIQVHYIYCALCIYYYFISSTPDH